MGNISQFSCPDCRQVWRINLGHGINHAVLDRVLKEFSEQAREKILARIGQQQILDFDFNYRAAVCSRCGDVVSVPVLSIYSLGETFVGECPTCDRPVEIREGEGALVCPRCGAVHLEEQPAGLWD